MIDIKNFDLTLKKIIQKVILKHQYFHKFIYMNVCMIYKNIAINRIDISERIDINKTDASKECIILAF